VHLHSSTSNRILKCRLALPGLLALLLAACAPAQESTLAGDWNGVLEVQGARGRVTLHVIRLDDATWKGTLDSPAEGVKGAPLDEIRLDLNLVRFHCNAISASYFGKLSGDVINGTLKQRGFALKLVFERSVANPSPPRTKARPGMESKP
jgi:hypothetical protein